VNEDKATRYHRHKRLFEVAAAAWSFVLLATLLATGGSVALRSATQSAVEGLPAFLQHPAAVIGYVTLAAALAEIGSAPLAFYGGFVLEARYGLSMERFGAWAWDQVKSFLLLVVLGSAGALVVYALIGRFPANWWAPAGLACALMVVGLAGLAPALLLPLFYSVKPLGRESLRLRLILLAERAGAKVTGAYEWGLGEKTRKANAALTGLGSTRRILVSDTMLADYSEDEIEVVLAHELAHHVHGDIWKGLLFESALMMAAFFAASRALSASWRVVGLSGPADVAGLPLLLLAGGALSLLTLPAAHAMSRAFERRADRFALALTNNPTAFVSAMKRLAAQNLAEDDPARFTRWLFYSHPPIRDRIAAAESFKARRAQAGFAPPSS
jgi:STE24 endopeptidase